MGLLQQVLGDGSGGGQVVFANVVPLRVDGVTPLQLERISAGVVQVFTVDGLHVGNFKQIRGVWKFKAIGYDATGQVVPGGGPLTDKHNTVFVELDDARVSQMLVKPYF